MELLIEISKDCFRPTGRCAKVAIVLFLLAIICFPPASAQEAAWPFQVDAGQFRIHSDAELGDLKEFIQEIQRLPTDLRERLGVPTSDQQIQFVLFKSDSEYQRYMKHYFPQVPSRRALFIKDRGPGFVFAYRHSDLGIDLRHECTHALLQETLPSLPLWLDEGLAEYFEMSDDQRLTHSAHLKEVRWQVSLGNVRPIATLEAISDIRQIRDVDYRDAWAWVHFLLHGSESGKVILHSYLHDIANRNPSIKLSQRIQQSMPEWRSEFIEHFRSSSSSIIASASIANSINEKWIVR